MSNKLNNAKNRCYSVLQSITVSCSVLMLMLRWKTQFCKQKNSEQPNITRPLKIDLNKILYASEYFGQ